MATESFVLVLTRRPEQGMIRYSITYPNGLTVSGAESKDADVMTRFKGCLRKWDEQTHGLAKNG